MLYTAAHNLDLILAPIYHVSVNDLRGRRGRTAHSTARGDTGETPTP